MQIWLFALDDVIEGTGLGPAEVARVLAPYLRVFELPSDPIDGGRPLRRRAAGSAGARTTGRYEVARHFIV